MLIPQNRKEGAKAQKKNKTTPQRRKENALSHNVIWDMTLKENQKIRKNKAFTPDDYIKFVDFFNKFINHAKKLRSPFVEKDMRI
ncbi:MAG: hypothetical protein WC412_06925 [Candidatus Omnitrophota bacterium]|jgi:leucyl aminopeptidase (aminopeptidase T)